MSNRPLYRSSFLRDLRADRIECPVVCEVGRRAFPSFDSTPAATLSTWRGRSGQRHHFTVQPLTVSALLEADRAVVMAVAPGPDGNLRILRATADLAAEGARDWIDSMRRAGATELLVLRYGAGTADRVAILADLAPSIVGLGEAA